VVGRDPARDDVEAAVRKRKILGSRDDCRLHPGRGIDADDLATCFAKSPGDVPAPGRDVEGLNAGTRLAPLDQQVEIGTFAMDCALPERLRPLRPKIRHAASSTARRAASSIVGST
jgi:hypothetical protein